MDFALRLAHPDDAHALARLRWDFRSEVAEPTEDREAFLARCSNWMTERLDAASHWRCWVAEDPAGNTVACLWFCLLEKLPSPVDEAEHHAYITSVYVAPRYRREGLGARLMSVAMEFATDAGCDSAILWPTARSRSLYERFGFAVRDGVMEAIVTPGRKL